MPYWQQNIVRLWDALPNEGGQFMGTAFFITHDLLLTAKHVVEPCDNVFLEGTPDGGKEKVEKNNIIFHENRDIAILKTNRQFSNIDSVPFLYTKLELTQNVSLLGYFDEIQSIHIVSSQISGHVSSIHTWRTQGSISRGMSGGPVIIGNQLIGVIQARDTDKNLSYIIPIEAIEAFLQEVNKNVVLPEAQLFGVPLIPRNYLPRNTYINTVKEILFNHQGSNIGLTGVAQSIGLQGMGGIGKSALAIILANDKQVRSTFYDGIIWVSLGQNPDIIAIQKEILYYLDISDVQLNTANQGITLLKNILSSKKILLILDDVWSIEHLKYLNIGSTKSKILITTRFNQVLSAIGAEECKIDVLSDVQAVKLLCSQANILEKDVSDISHKIAKECGFLPLALTMIGSMLSGKPLNRWERTLKHLQNADLHKIQKHSIDYPYPDLFKALHVSVEALPKVIETCYLELAIFPEDKIIPESVLELYWNKETLQTYDPIEIIDDLLDSSLIFRFNDEHISIHDLMRDYMRSQLTNIMQYHERLVDIYSLSNLNTIPIAAQSYLNNNIIYHLQEMRSKSKCTLLINKFILERPEIVCKDIKICSKLAEKSVDEVAISLLTFNKHPVTLIACMKILKEKAKPYAHKLILEQSDQSVISTCLKVLRKGAKRYARRLIKEDQGPHVLIECINILGRESTNDVKRLLKTHHNSEIIVKCIHFLKDEAKEDAKRLIKTQQSAEVITACLRVLGDEAKEDAKRLIKTQQSAEVITACLKILGDEAKEDAKKLIQTNQEGSILIMCLKLLGNEAKEDAKKLIQTSQDSAVLIACLNILGNEAKKDALKLLKNTHTNGDVSLHTACLLLLGKDGISDAKRLLNDNIQDSLRGVCIRTLAYKGEDFYIENFPEEDWLKLNSLTKLSILLANVDSPIREKRAKDILKIWYRTNRGLVTSALHVFTTQPNIIESFCSDILKKWKRELTYNQKNNQKNNSAHIIRSLGHPALRELALKVANQMIDEEVNNHGLLDHRLKRVIYKIINGTHLTWDKK